MKFHEFDTMEQAERAANEFGLNNSTTALRGTHYHQGGRDFVQLVLPMSKLFDLTRRSPRPKRGEPKPDPATTRQRPLDPPHVHEIVTYLRKNDTYLIPPIIVNSAVELHIFVVKAENVTKPCILVLPDTDALYITDGQHRVEALREATDGAEAKKELWHDAIGVTLIEETDIQRIHQDFYDAAQTKKLEPSLLVEYDGRSMGNALARDISTTVPLFKERTERFTNSISQNSLMLYSTNHIKLGCFFLVLGETKGKAANVLERVNQKISPAYDSYVRCLQAFFAHMCTHNVQWRKIIESPIAAAKVIDPVPDFRLHYLHCVAGGLNVMCAVGHSILSMQETITADFTAAQEAKLTELATFNWRRDNPLWRGGIVSTSGTITPHRGNLQLAIALVKEQLDLTLASGDQSALKNFRTTPETAELEAGVGV